MTRSVVVACGVVGLAAGCAAPEDGAPQEEREVDWLLEERSGELVAPSAGGIPASFVGDFETGALRWSYREEAWAAGNGQWDFLRGAPPDSTRLAGAQVSVTSNPAIVRQGRFAGRFVLHPGDSADPDLTSNERLEVRSTLAQAGAVEGQEAWYSWSTYFPTSFRTRRLSLAPGNAVFTDWKPSGPIVNACIGNATFGYLTPTAVFRAYAEPTGQGPVRPRLELTISGGELEQTNPTRRECSGAVARTFVLMEPFVPGGWVDFVYHVKWSSHADEGFVEVWVNGQQVVRRTAAATLYAGAAAYFKQGLYRAASPDVSWVVIDGTRRGRSYAEVAPR